LLENRHGLAPLSELVFLLLKLRNEAANCGHRFGFAVDAADVDRLRVPVQDRCRFLWQRASVTVCPNLGTFHTDFGLLNAEESEGSEDSGVAEDSRDAVRAHRTLGLFHFQ